jgi:hypothetical protein
VPVKLEIMASKEPVITEDQDHQQAESVQIDKWDGCALKNTLDDHVMKIFIEQLGYTLSHTLFDTRLAICFAAVGSALFALVWDFLHPFPVSKQVLTICVISYFVLMAVLTVYGSFVGKLRCRIARLHVQLIRFFSTHRHSKQKNAFSWSPTTKANVGPYLRT